MLNLIAAGGTEWHLFDGKSLKELAWLPRAMVPVSQIVGFGSRGTRLFFYNGKPRSALFSGSAAADRQ